MLDETADSGMAALDDRSVEADVLDRRAPRRP